MTEKLLRDILEEAKEKNQIALLIWANWTVWDLSSFDMEPGNEIYDFALSQISKGEEAVISAECGGLIMNGIIAVPVQKLISSNDFFRYVVRICQEGHYIGPITLVPLNKLSKFC